MVAGTDKGAGGAALVSAVADYDEPPHRCGCVEVGPLLVAPGASGRSWTCETCGRTWTPASVDRCPMGGEHDPGDSDRPCPRCGASPR